ncbi:MAG: response regulator [bacterium]
MSQILIVDDNPLIRATLKVMVEKMGHEVTGEAGNGTVALELFARLRPEAVLLDILLPDKSGLELMDSFRELDDSARILVITAVEQTRVDEHAVKSGCRAVLHKPFSFEALKSSLEKILAP